MWVLLSAVIFGLVLAGTFEYLGRKRIMKDESLRKIAHILVALLYGLLPFFVDIRLVTYGALLHLIGAIVARKFKLFTNARRIDRHTYGEIAFPAGAFLASLLTDSDWVFAAAMLIVGVSDLLAAIIGKKYGRNNTYKIAGQKKSVAGSLAFYVSSLVIIILTLIQLDVSGQMLLLTALWVPLLLTATENTGVYGFDNLTIPIVTVGMLNMLSM
jgi:phosphatidate cytidylyltransferase/phytol kinase